MRISKDRAREIASTLTREAYKKVQDLNKAYEKLALDIYISLLPPEVVAFADKYPQHICWADNIYLDGHGFNREHVNIGHKDVIANQQGYAIATMEMTAAIGNKLRKAREAWKDAAKAYEALKKETEVALLNLRTTTRIRQEFPIAIPYLGYEGKGNNYPLPVVNITPLIKKLEKIQPKKTA